MNNQLVQEITQRQIRKDLPPFNPGDTIRVAIRIIEGGKERIQNFEGVVIAKKGGGISETFIIRKSSQGIGVERTFFLNSPIIQKIDVLKRGKVRRAKLFYLRGRSAKNSKIKEIF